MRGTNCHAVYRHEVVGLGDDSSDELPGRSAVMTAENELCSSVSHTSGEAIATETETMHIRVRSYASVGRCQSLDGSGSEG